MTQLTLPFDDPTPTDDTADREVRPPASLAIDIVRLGFDATGPALARLQRLYAAKVAPLDHAVRMRLLLAVCEILQEFHARLHPAHGAGGTNALLPFLLDEASAGIVSTAALEVAAQMPLQHGDPLTGPRVVRDLALAEGGWRVGAILRGLICLGDEAAVGCVHGLWRSLDAQAAAALAEPGVTLATDALVGFYVDWLADAVIGPDEGLVGSIAGTLAGLPSHSPSIARLRRAYPGWSAADGSAVEIEETWTFAAFADRVAPALEEIAALEAPPQVVPDILPCWRTHQVH